MIVTWMFASSLVGAALFFVGGYLMRGMRVEPGGAALAPNLPPPVSAGDGAELADLRSQRAALQGELDRSKAEVKQQQSQSKKQEGDLKKQEQQFRDKETQFKEKEAASAKTVAELRSVAASAASGDDDDSEKTQVTKKADDSAALRTELLRVKADAAQRDRATTKKTAELQAAVKTAEAKASEQTKMLEKAKKEAGKKPAAAKGEDSSALRKEIEQLKGQRDELAAKAIEELGKLGVPKPLLKRLLGSDGGAAAEPAKSAVKNTMMGAPGAAAANDAEAKKLRGELEKIKADAATAEKAAKAEAAELRTLLEQAQASVGDDTVVRPTVDSDEALAKAESKAKELEGKITQLQLTVRTAEEKSAQSDRLNEQLDEAREELKELENDSVSMKEHQELKAKQRDMLVKAQMMQQRVAELERYADEAVELRQKSGESAAILQEVEALRENKKDLEAKLFATGYREEKTASGPGPKAPLPRKKGEEVSVGTSLDDHLDSVIKRGEAEALVISDEQGLLLSSAGEVEIHEALAVVASMVQQLGERSSELLPLTKMRSAELVDGNGASLYAHSIEVEGSFLTVAALRNQAVEHGLGEVVGDLARIIQRIES